MRTAIAAIIAAICLPASASSDLVECNRIYNTDGYKVLLNELSYAEEAFRTDRDFQRMMDRLHFKLRGKIEEVHLDFAPLLLATLRCMGRQPRDGNEYDQALVNILNAHNVILEVWGMLEAKKSRGQVRQRQARLGYAVIPLRFYQFFESRSKDLSGIYFVQYPKTSLPQNPAFDDLFDQAVEINAYVAPGVGMKLIKTRDFDHALQYLCKAEILLNKAVSQSRSTMPDKYETALIDYIRQSAKDTVNSAINDPQYKGALKLISPKDFPCPNPGGQGHAAK